MNRKPLFRLGRARTKAIEGSMLIPRSSARGDRSSCDLRIAEVCEPPHGLGDRGDLVRDSFGPFRVAPLHEDERFEFVFGEGAECGAGTPMASTIAR